MKICIKVAFFISAGKKQEMSLVTLARFSLSGCHFIFLLLSIIDESCSRFWGLHEFSCKNNKALINNVPD